MKWITHEAVAVGCAYLLGMPPQGLAGVFLGSILPDLLDQMLARLLVCRQWAFNRIHRGATHWFGWWLALFAATLPQALPFAKAAPDTLFVVGLGFGGLMHVLLDLCTVTGVPVAPWSKKTMISLKLCSTGSLREYAFLAVTLLVFGFAAGQDLLKLTARFRNLLP